MTVSVLVGETVTGRITDTIPVTSLRWAEVLNGPEAIDITVPLEVVRDHDLRQKTAGARNFLAVEVDGRVKAAGPIWTRRWNWEKTELSIAAKGMWSLADHRVIFDQTVPDQILTFTGKSLGGTAVAMVQHMLGYIPPYTNLPIVLPAIEAGDHEESFPRWNLSRYGEQLRQITQRAVDAPDIRFLPRRNAADLRFMEWAMLVGTEAQPSLTQGGDEWIFDTTAPKSPVAGISTDEDASQMASMTWATGNGSEDGMLMATGQSVELVNLGYPLTEVDESHPTVETYPILTGHANNLLARSSRPIEVFKVTVRADAAQEVQSGHYARLIVKGDPWLDDMDRSMRVKQVSGDLSDNVVLDMYPMAGAL